MPVRAALKRLSNTLFSLRSYIADQNFEIEKWYPRPDSNRHALRARDFKSLVSTNSTTRAETLLLLFLDQPRAATLSTLVNTEGVFQR